MRYIQKYINSRGQLCSIHHHRPISSRNRYYIHKQITVSAFAECGFSQATRENTSQYIIKVVTTLTIVYRILYSITCALYEICLIPSRKY